MNTSFIALFCPKTALFGTFLTIKNDFFYDFYLTSGGLVPTLDPTLPVRRKLNKTK